MSDHDRQNVEFYADVFRNGSDEAKQYLRDQGIEGVVPRNDGGFNVTYNSEGLKQMGVVSVDTIGKGENKRIVETKENDAIIPTYNTVNVNPGVVGNGKNPERIIPPNANGTLRPTQF